MDELQICLAKFFAMVMSSIFTLIILVPVCWITYFVMQTFVGTSDLLTALTSLVVTGCFMLKIEQTEHCLEFPLAVEEVKAIKNTLGRIEVTLNQSKIG